MVCFKLKQKMALSRGIHSLAPGLPQVVLNGTLHERSEVVKDFTPKCGGINRGDTPRGPKAPRGVPEVDPDTRGE